MNLVPAVLLALELPLLWYGFFFLAPSVRETSLVPARYWLAEGGSIPRDAGSRLLACLSWRCIGGFTIIEQ